jgi:signal transduction histidine kinase/ActR/RegA family two-component response regulator
MALLTRATFNSQSFTRLALAVGCGAATWTLNQIPAQILSAETPKFALGGAFVLFAFRALGPLPGLLAAVIGYASASSVSEVVLVATALYAIEGYVVTRLADRTRSLVVADVLFWLTGGALLDAVAYLWWMSLTPGFVLLLVVKQILNGVLNAVLAEWGARSPWVRARLGLPAESLRSWREVLFDRTVPIVMVPMAIIVLLLARASNAAARNQLAAELRQVAASADEGADRFLRSRLASLEDLQDAVFVAGDPAGQRTATLLRDFVDAHGEFVNVFVTNAAGTVVAAAPERSSTGALNVGRDISRRPYFTAARTSRRPEFGDLVLGQLRVRRHGVEPILPVAVPLITAQGGFGGVVMGALDVAALRAILRARASRGEGAVQLLDRTGRVVASSNPRWPPGTPRSAELRDAIEDHESVVQTIASASTDTYTDRLGVAPRLTTLYRVSAFPFSILVDEPMSTVHHEMIPTSLALVALMLVALLAVYAVARTLGAQLVAPLRSIGAVAEDLANGQLVPREILHRFGSSPVQEIRTLGAQFSRMDDALRERREADAQAVQRSESRYRETLEQLAQAQKMEGIGRLAGGIAHDFNNLLTPIVGYTDLALSSVPADNPARKDLALVRTAAGRAKEVVAQLLAFGRAQVLDTRRIDLAEVVAEFEPLLRKSLSVNHDLTVIAEPGIIVDADRAKVQQVLMNLVLNAADAMPSGGRVEVRVGVADIDQPDPSDPEPLARGAYGVIEVEDVGVGMDEETQRRAFDPFFTTKPRGKGTGLGLSTAYGIARQHRGTIEVVSALGEGTRMRVLLPLATAVPHLVDSAPPLPDVLISPGMPADEGARTICVVEDEGAVRELVRVTLTRAGFRVLAARDGEEALTRVAAYDGRIDLLLSDVVMPGLSGPELARRMRQARPSARVLFMSGYASDVIADEGGSISDGGLLAKPFTPDELVARVREAIDGKV